MHQLNFVTAMCFKRHIPGEPPPPRAAQPGHQDLVGWTQTWLSSQPGDTTGSGSPWTACFPLSVAGKVALVPCPACPTSRCPQAGLLSHMGMLAPWSAAATGDGDSWMEPPGPVSCCQAPAQLSKIMSAQPTCISSCFALREKRFL